MQRLLPWSWIPLLSLLLVAGCSTTDEKGGAGRVEIIKVLPHLLDQEGNHTLSPSLYERDAYQDYLRRRPEDRSALRFDVRWRAPVSRGVVLKVEMRGIQNKQTTLALLESTPMAHPGGREWSALVLNGDAYQSFGELQAWRATLWSGDLLLDEQRSFLW